ncbi:ABC transporter [Rhabdochromatium marinum]|nr:ABC transporter [Rhabdochromatium marinum]
MSNLLTSAWRFRHYIGGAILNTFRARLARSRLGAVWMILNPLALVAIYALVLSVFLAGRLPGLEGRFSFAIYLTAGIFAWTLFCDLLTRGVTLFIDHANLIKKVAFPRISLLLTVVGVALIDNLMLLLAVILIFGVLGHWPDAHILWLPLLVALNLGIGLGLGLLLGVLNVFIRDIGQVVPVVLQFTFWLTPIVYAHEMLPPAAQTLTAFNPLVPLITSYQDVMVFARAPQPLALLELTLLAILLLALAQMLFRRASPEMVDAL